MQVGRNYTPTFGCRKCQEAKELLIKAGADSDKTVKHIRDVKQMIINKPNFMEYLKKNAVVIAKRINENIK
ncbi:MAG: hypothetical protein A2104_03100 [Candidatus Melainabacteria bacterium GWF2_32_7]|nr:MAG: hypothetical protein A2104_03100 [Candidatus Melainabacteria bacterium GWF2_32_7]